LGFRHQFGWVRAYIVEVGREPDITIVDTHDRAVISGDHLAKWIEPFKHLATGTGE
jgi:uncharacterized protein (DUF2336 family)